MREHVTRRGGVWGIMHSPVSQQQWGPLQCFKQENDVLRFAF